MCRPLYRRFTTIGWSHQCNERPCVKADNSIPFWREIRHVKCWPKRVFDSVNVHLEHLKLHKAKNVLVIWSRSPHKDHCLSSWYWKIIFDWSNQVACGSHVANGWLDLCGCSSHWLSRIHCGWFDDTQVVSAIHWVWRKEGRLLASSSDAQKVMRTTLHGEKLSLYM